MMCRHGMGILETSAVSEVLDASYRALAIALYLQQICSLVILTIAFISIGFKTKQGESCNREKFHL